MIFLITAGPTREYIDPVRFISNPSSGKMGYALARAALRRGHKVILVSGPSALCPPSGASVIFITTADEMFVQVKRYFKNADIIIGCAAVSDWKVKRHSSKIKKDIAGPAPVLVLRKNPDIIKWAGINKGHRTVVGFSSESSCLEKNSRKKLNEKHLDLIVGNLIKDGFGTDTNKILILGKNCRLSSRGRKGHLAKVIIGAVENYHEKKKR